MVKRRMTRAQRERHFDRHWRQAEKDYERLSELTGIPLPETPNHSYGVVVRHGEGFGKIGICTKTKDSTYYFRFKDGRELGFDRQGLGSEVYWANNPRLVLLVHSKLDISPLLLHSQEAVKAGEAEYPPKQRNQPA